MLSLPLFALDPGWNDFYTAAGFWVGVVGFVVGVVGFAYTIYQVKKTTSAAIAAERAAEQTRDEVRTSFRRFVGGFAHRFLADARTAVESENWPLAAFRSNDLADLIGQLPEQTARSANITDRFRAFAQVFAVKAKEPKKRYSTPKWQTLLREALTLLDRVQSPFSHPKEEIRDPERPTPTPRQEATGENAGEGGELD